MKGGEYYEYTKKAKSSVEKYFSGNFPPKKHNKAKAKIRQLVRQNWSEITLHDGSGWSVTLLPRKGKYCTPSGCATLEKGMDYIEQANAGMIDDWDWRVFANKEELRM